MAKMLKKDYEDMLQKFSTEKISKEDRERHAKGFEIAAKALREGEPIAFAFAYAVPLPLEQCNNEHDCKMQGSTGGPPTLVMELVSTLHDQVSRDLIDQLVNRGGAQVFAVGGAGAKDLLESLLNGTPTRRPTKES